MYIITAIIIEDSCARLLRRGNNSYDSKSMEGKRRSDPNSTKPGSIGNPGHSQKRKSAKQKSTKVNRGKE